MILYELANNYMQLEETIRGLYFASIIKTCGIGMVHFIMDVDLIMDSARFL